MVTQFASLSRQSLRHQNLTYHLTYYGPAIGCVEADNATSTFLRQAVQQFKNETGKFLYWSIFVPDQNFRPGINGSFFDPSSIANSPTLDTFSKGAASKVLPLSDPSMTFEEYLLRMEEVFQNMTLSLRFGHKSHRKPTMSQPLL